jgi:hypothetical protein
MSCQFMLDSCGRVSIVRRSSVSLAAGIRLALLAVEIAEVDDGDYDVIKCRRLARDDVNARSARAHVNRPHLVAML